MENREWKCGHKQFIICHYMTSLMSFEVIEETVAQPT